MTVTKERYFASEFEIVFRVELVEASCGWARQDILADTCQHDFFKLLASVFEKSRHVKLKHRANTSIGCTTRGGLFFINPLGNTGFTVTHDRA